VASFETTHETSDSESELGAGVDFSDAFEEGPIQKSSPQPTARHKSPLWRTTNYFMLGTIGVNTVIPVIDAILPGDAGPLELQTRQLLTQIDQQRKAHQLPTELRDIPPFDASPILKDIPSELSPRLTNVEATLHKADEALGLPRGSLKQLAVEGVAAQAGVSDSAAQALGHSIGAAESAAKAAQVAIEEFQKIEDKEAFVKRTAVEVSILADRLASDPNLAKAFLAGYVVVPDVLDAVFDPMTQTGLALWHAQQRHEAAMETLRHPNTGNEIVDRMGASVAWVIDLVLAGVSAYGPGHLLGVGSRVAGGANLVLAAGEGLLAQTAMLGTQKTLAHYTHIPEEAAAFFAGVLAASAQRQVPAAVESEADATRQHLAVTGHDLKEALEVGEGQQVRQVLKHAAETMTPSERVALTAVVRAIAEHLVLAAG
jgi:hypothetical protein